MLGIDPTEGGAEEAEIESEWERFKNANDASRILHEQWMGIAEVALGAINMEMAIDEMKPVEVERDQQQCFLPAPSPVGTVTRGAS